MTELKVKKREDNLKGRRLRREGIIPAVLFGKHLAQSINIQIPLGDAEHFLKNHTIGSKLELVISRKKHLALLKEVTYIPVVNSIEHISFQALTADEKVSSTAHIHLLHKEKIEGIVQQIISEISYSAFPADLIETIEVDLTGFKVGDIIKVSDLPVVKNEKLDIQTALDEVVVSITAPKEFVEETVETEEGEEAIEAPAPVEVPVIEKKKSEEE
jgi:large subunit ribosomal protein L25